jgi:hypothetical protein
MGVHGIRFLPWRNPWALEPFPQAGWQAAILSPLRTSCPEEHQHKQKGMDESLLSHPGPKNSDPFWRGGKGGKSFVAFVCVCVCVFASIYSIDLAASISSEKKLSSFYNSFG